MSTKVGARSRPGRCSTCTALAAPQPVLCRAAPGAAMDSFSLSATGVGSVASAAWFHRGAYAWRRQTSRGSTGGRRDRVLAAVALPDRDPLAATAVVEAVLGG